MMSASKTGQPLPNDGTPLQRPSCWRVRVVCFLLAAAALAVFWGALRCNFVNYDDPIYVTSNADVRHGLTAAGVAWAFETGAASNWHPLTWLSHMADVQFYGLKPAGHHLTNVLLHAANAALLFLILNAMTGAFWRSAVVAALFALHPLRVESVVWVAERKDVLSTFFWMLTVWTYFKFQTSNLKSYYAAAVLCFACGLMAKPMLVTLPFVLLLLDYWPLGRRMRWELLIEKIPFFILAAVSSAVTFVVQRRGGAVSALTRLPLSARIDNALISYVRYLEKIFWPSRLAVLYPYPGHWPVWQVAGAALLLAAITAGVIWRGRAQPYLAVGWFWFLGMLAPAIGLVQVGIQSMADRYSYLPMVGVSIMAAWGVSDMLAQRPGGRWILGTAGGVAIAACIVLTPLQVRYWRDSGALFEHAIEVTTNNFLAYNNLGNFLSDRKESEKAMLYYRSALQINPKYDKAYNNLGCALAELGHYQEATNQYIKALSVNPGFIEAHNNLGMALGNLGLTNGAMHEYRAALQINPNFAVAHDNLGTALLRKGRAGEALSHYQEALKFEPANAKFQNNMAWLLATCADASLRNGHKAVELAQQANELSGGEKPGILDTLAAAYAEAGRFSDAIRTAQKAMELARAAGQQDLVEELKGELKGYQAGLPCRQ
jgi:tetratricopeptide (TPR) repeat protein